MKVIPLNKLNIHSRIPNDLNDLMDGKEIKRLLNSISAKQPRFKLIGNELWLTINNVKLAKLSVKVDKVSKRFVIIAEV